MVFERTFQIYTTYPHVFFLGAFRYHAIHKEVYDWFDISFDKFGRTSTPEQTEVCQAIFKKLWENKWLSENTMQQVDALILKCQLALSDRKSIHMLHRSVCGF